MGTMTAARRAAQDERRAESDGIGADFRTTFNVWLADVRTMETATPRHRVAVRCYFSNWLTSPSALRSDSEYRLCRFVARRVRAQLQTMGGWKTNLDGRYFC